MKSEKKFEMKKPFLIPACVLAFWKKTDTTFIYIGAVILELGAIYFLVQSILTVIPDGESNWYLPVALDLNCIAMCLNTVHRAKEKKDAKS